MTNYAFLTRRITETIGVVFSTICISNVSCNKEEPIPSYIHIDKITLTTKTDGTEGSSAHKIIDAWIYIDDNLVGAFEMPCTVPVLYEGSHKIKIRAGVIENGISETRVAYPFYAPYEQTTTLTRGQITTLVPTVGYFSGTAFSWLENFDSASGICTSNGTTPDTSMKITNDASIVFEGAGSATVSITATNSSYFGVCCSEQTLPQAGANVFVELNYNCNSDFNVGVEGYDANGNVVDQQIALSLRSTDGWNKVYVNLTNEVSSMTSASKFAVFFSMLKDQTVSASYFYIDNAKLVN